MGDPVLLKRSLPNVSRNNSILKEHKEHKDAGYRIYFSAAWWFYTYALLRVSNNEGNFTFRQLYSASQSQKSGIFTSLLAADSPDHDAINILAEAPGEEILHA